MDNINDLVNQIETAKKFFGFYNLCDNVDDYSAAVLYLARPVETMLKMFLLENRLDWDNRILPIDNIDGHMHFTTIYAFIESNGVELGVSKGIIEYIRIIHQTRNVAAHLKVSYEQCVLFYEAFSVFISWFIANSEGIQSMEIYSKNKLIKKLLSTANEFVSWTYINENSSIDLPLLDYQNENVDQSLKPEQFMTMTLTMLKNINNNVAHIEKKIDRMGEEIHKIYEKMVDYQTLLERQLDMAASNDEIDRIIKAYSDEISTRLAREVSEKIAQEDFDKEKAHLEETLGIEVWNKLDTSSQEFLITAKVTYNSYQKISNAVDYSGVCLLVTKAIEVEMSNRFCRDYLEYLKEKYPGRNNLITNLPIVLLNKYKKPIKPKDFTLGSVIYVLGVEFDPNVSEMDKGNIKSSIRDFVREKLMKGKNDIDIDNALELIGRSVDEIRNDYRNPSAHTNQLQKINAKECFDLVLDVQKMLKTILDLLEY